MLLVRPSLVSTSKQIKAPQLHPQLHQGANLWQKNYTLKSGFRSQIGQEKMKHKHQHINAKTYIQEKLQIKAPQLHP